VSPPARNELAVPPENVAGVTNNDFLHACRESARLNAARTRIGERAKVA
jgi:hypothetical protein